MGVERRVERRDSINSDVNTTECPLEIKLLYGPWSLPRPGERMRKRRGRCPMSNIVLGQQEMEAASPTGPVPSLRSPVRPPLSAAETVSRHLSHGTAAAEKRDPTETCTMYPSPCVPTSHSRRPDEPQPWCGHVWGRHALSFHQLQGGNPTAPVCTWHRLSLSHLHKGTPAV